MKSSGTSFFVLSSTIRGLIGGVGFLLHGIAAFCP
jgi:hypothetical protein